MRTQWEQVASRGGERDRTEDTRRWGERGKKALLGDRIKRGAKLSPQMWDSVKNG